MIKKYDYTLETTNLNVFSKLQHLFADFSVDYISSTEIDDNDKIYKISYSEDDIDACANKDEFLNLLEDLALCYNL